MSTIIERTLRGGAGFFLANVITKGFGFLFIVIASRIFGPAEFGVLALALSVFGVAQRIAMFGLPNTIQRFFSGSGEDQLDKIYAAVLITAAVGGSVGAAALYIGAPLLASEFVFGNLALQPVLRVLSIAVAASVIFEVSRAVLQAQERVRDIVVAESVRSIGKPLVLSLFFIMGVQKATAGGWALAVAFGIGAAVCVPCLRRLSVRPDWRNLKTSLRKVLVYSGPLLFVGFSYFLAQQADRLMLGWLSSASQVGLYTTTSTLAMIMSTLHGALVSIFMPLASDAYRQSRHEEVRTAYQFIARWMGVANGLCLLIFVGVGGWILHIFGPEYATPSTYAALVILSTLYFLGTWVGPTGALLQMTDGHRAELFNTAVFVVANIASNYVLIPRYGLVGAALATFGSGVLRNVLQLAQIWRWLEITPLSSRNLIVGALTLGSVILAVMIPHDLTRLVVATASILIIGGYVLVSVTNEEKQALKRLCGQRT